MTLRHISDTARWIAVLRAQETQRSDRLFNDPLAARLGGVQGLDIAQVMKKRSQMPAWPIVMRTIVLDEHILRGVADGVDMVIDLAAGLDTRPYRLALPPTLTWVDVDFAGITEEKNRLLADETPHCRVERIACDLADAEARRALFAQLGARCTKALVIAEGLLVYLTDEQVSGLAKDLAAVPTFKYWTLEMVNRLLLARLQKTVGKRLAAAGMPMQWGTDLGPAYFEPLGWRLVEDRSMFHEALKHGRLPWIWALLARILPRPTPPWKHPWAGVCLFERRAA
ncbi:MAG TPA: SAM-dependent methyltransferase [Gemmatimonadales bacterium]|nr:SAM-dependent methyltransferase [Gemmatimonadales bacterium]